MLKIPFENNKLRTEYFALSACGIVPLEEENKGQWKRLQINCTKWQIFCKHYLRTVGFFTSLIEIL